jgi:diadenosine tetraphosphatase ApaH/serine/threonine PP2A family protein phosphatase
VLAAADAERVDEIWCLGDTVGYGPQPNECCAVVSLRTALGLVGNHDLVALGTDTVSVAEFNPDAAAAVAWTRSTLDDGARAYLEVLSPEARRDGIVLFHGSPFDPVWGYVLSVEDAMRSLELTTEPLLLVGHSHIPLAVTSHDDGIEGGHAPGGTEVDLAGGRWLLNPGSVGQPRDGDPRAAYLLLDLDAGRASFRRLSYSVERTQAEMQDAGLPPALAERLAYGV